MRKLLAVTSIVASTMALGPARAADITVSVAAYQYHPSGWVTLDPLGISNGAGTVQTPPGTGHDAPTVARNDTILFENLDRLPHNVTWMSGPPCEAPVVCTWDPVVLTAGGSSALDLVSTDEEPFALGTYTYLCTIHRGMRGSFVVA